MYYDYNWVHGDGDFANTCVTNERVIRKQFIMQPERAVFALTLGFVSFAEEMGRGYGKWNLALLCKSIKHWFSLMSPKLNYMNLDDFICVF
jgi:hypothetical protein